MHYLGLVFVKEATTKAVADVMAVHKDDSWDWYRCGGRWDGWLQGEEGAKRRETHDGFNFDKSNDDAERNACKVSDLPADKRPHFFVADDDFVPREHFDRYARNKRGGYGAIKETPDWEERFRAALAKYPDHFVVVVDAHN